MPKFQVSMQRIITELATAEIEASDIHEAYRKVNAERESLSWSATDVDYEYPEIEEVA